MFGEIGEREDGTKKGRLRARSEADAAESGNHLRASVRLQLVCPTG